jgi:fumarate hydratase subunit alpha
MRAINISEITSAVKKLCMDANYYLDDDVMEAFKKGIEKEESPVGKALLKELIENAEIAKTEQVPMCQDTGFGVVFIDVGQEVHFEGGDINEAINKGVRQGYEEGYLRKSICDPFTRANTKDNTPAIIHYDIIPGDKVKITVAPKGGGSENMSRVVMLKPSDGKKGIMDYVVQRCKEAGGNPCPPVVVGVGIGGTFEKAAILAKKSLLRELGSKNPDPELAEMEEEMLKRINALGSGPMGLGGRIYALGVHIIKHPCHIASLPLAVNINCHAHRHKSIEI